MNKLAKLSLPEWGLLALVGATFLLGGSSRADMAQLILLRPAAIAILFFALFLCHKQVWQDNRRILGLFGAWIGLSALHLLPLPPAVWTVLPGRELAAEIANLAGLDQMWQPLSLVPYRTVNAIISLLLPLAGLLLASMIARHRLELTVFLFLAIVLASAGLGLLQLIGTPGGPFYFYSITNAESSVGLFANRNHNAIMLAIGFPLLACCLALLPTSKEHVRAREWMAAGLGVLLIPFLLMTQSRAGLVIGLVGIASAFWVYKSPLAAAQKRRRELAFDPRIAFGGLVAAGVALITVAQTQGNALSRMLSLGAGDDELRLRIWGPIAELAWDFMPFGSGVGTFVEVFQVVENNADLGTQYINHAHNDLLEITVTGGLPALIILGVGVFYLLSEGRRRLATDTDRKSQSMRRLGAVTCAILALGSLYDYPLRTPSLALLLAIAVVWLTGRSGSQDRVVSGSGTSR